MLKRNIKIGIIIIILIIICFKDLGSTGLIDESAVLFASSGRNMAKSGNWLTPTVNGLPRFHKPPLVYWFMGLIYSLPNCANL